MEDAGKVEAYLKNNAENNRYEGEGTPAYAPQRDITTLFPLMANQLWLDITSDGWNKRYSSLLKKWKFSVNQLLDAYNLYIDTLTHFQNGVAETFDEAANLTGFSGINPRLMLLIEAMVGRYAAAAWFYGIKDISIQGEDPPPFSGYETFMKLLEEIKDGLDGVESEYARQHKEFMKKEKDPEKVKIGKRSKARGKRFERKAAHILTDLLGVQFRRGVQYQGGHDSDDVVSDIEGLHWEMKFVEKLNIETAMVQSETDAKPGEVPVVFHARSRKEPMITIRAKNLIPFVKIINQVLEENKDVQSVSYRGGEQSEAGLDGVCESAASAVELQGRCQDPGVC